MTEIGGFRFQIKWESLNLLFFWGEGKPSQSKDKNQQQPQPRYDAESGNQTQATFVGGKYSHHHVVPVLQSSLEAGQWYDINEPSCQDAVLLLLTVVFFYL